MTTEILVPEKEPTLAPRFQAVAVNGTEMAVAKDGIKSWLENKLRLIDADIAEIQESYDAAVRHKWKASAFKNQISREKQKHLYYGKLLAAVNAGFTIVPNMDVNIFAIRTKRTDNPKWSGNSGTSPHGFNAASPSIPDEEEMRLPVGVGEYRSIDQEYHESRSKVIKDGKELFHVEQICDGYKDIEFPLAIAHPLVMDATARAMAMKIFDRIGVVPRQSRRIKGDPIVLGQITRKEGWSIKIASFLIAWYLDPRTL